MSFLNNLLKGFVRSAVNQVGRDGGKVVSNNLYGDSHSTPVRHVPNNKSKKYKNPNNNPDLFVGRTDLISKGDSILVKGFLAFMLCVFFMFVGNLILLWRWYVNKKKHVITKYEVIFEYNKIPDKRYADGYRYEGGKETHVPVKVWANESELKHLRLKSKVYLWISIITFVLFIIGGIFSM